MPWGVQDVDKHYGGLSDKQKRQWCHVANGALKAGDDDGTAIRKASGAVNNSISESNFKVGDKVQHRDSPNAVHGKISRISTDGHAQIVNGKKGFKVHVNDLVPYKRPNPGPKLANFSDKHSAVPDSKGKYKIVETFESVLYTKAAEYLRAARIREAALFWEAILNEADPKPRVEKDIKGEYVVPTENQFQQYFDTMTAANIDKALHQTRDRWSKAADDATDVKSKADKQAADLELKVGEAILQHKKASELGVGTTTPEIKSDVTEPELRSVIQNVVSMLMKAI